MKERTITDEKGCFKTVVKKAFFQPNFLKILLWTLFLLLTTVVFRGHYEGPIVTNIEDCAIIVFIAFGVLQTVARLIQFCTWYIKNKHELNENSQTIFDEPEKAEKLLQKWDIANVIQLVFMLIAVVVLGVGCCDITVHCWVCSVFIIISLFDAVKSIVGKENKKRFYATFAVVSAIVIAGVFGVTQWAGAEYDKNLSTMLNYNGVPISVSDIVETESACTDKSLLSKGTRLGHHYIFSSNYKEGENISYCFDYEVFISDYNCFTKNYIDLLHKRYKEYGNELIKSDETFGWDEVYYEVIDGKASQRGYAVKGNLVVMLDYANLPEETNFFEKAYTILN